MKSNMWLFALLGLLLCWTQPVSSKEISFIFNQPEAKPIIPMSMVEDAVDDLYFGCNETMNKLIKDKYFEEENKEEFADVWEKAEDCAKRNVEQKDKEDSALTKDHMQAICVYTSDYKKFYKKFNKAVRTGRKNYGTSDFKFHSLHFWLTSAVQILNNNKECHITYRRTTVAFTGNVNQIVRFGSFASSSERKDLEDFGNKTCFKIKTCFGARLKKYPRLGDKEQEVLIPPYEKFKIIKKTQKVEGLDDCEVVYILESAGLQSNLDCLIAN